MKNEHRETTEEIVAEAEAALKDTARMLDDMAVQRRLLDFDEAFVERSMAQLPADCREQLLGVARSMATLPSAELPRIPDTRRMLRKLV